MEKEFNETAVKMSPFGEAGILVEFGNSIHPETHRKVMALTSYLEKNPFPGMTEYIPAFASVAVFYDPAVTSLISVYGDEDVSVSYGKAQAALESALADLGETEFTEKEAVELPVCYGGDYGPDLDFVAQYHDITPEEVVNIHTGGEYLVYMIGFAPGFPYLGGMSEKIATPRRTTPRVAIPAGSVGIAGSQTGAYPLESPGGWQLIGRTPEKLFRPDKEPPIFLQAGDRVKFKAITSEEYKRLEEKK